MQLQVFFTPVDLRAVRTSQDDVYIVIDLIRATTTLTVMFEQGAAHVYVANSIEQARTGATLHPDRLLCGEQGALPPPGFDYGNSPTQFARTNLANRDLILATTNGSRAFFACPEDSVRLAGCLYNARAVTACALAAAQAHGSNIVIVCSGTGNRFSLDDTVCAGYLAQEAQRQYGTIRLHESALAAQAISEAYPPSRMLDYSHAAHSVINIGLKEDLDLCTRISTSNAVPKIENLEQDSGLLALVRGEF